MIPYILISGEILKDTNLTPMEKLLFSLLAVLTKKATQPTTVADSYMAESLGVSPSHINRMLSKLKSYGLVSMGRNYGRREISLTLKKSNGSDKFIYKFKEKNEKR